MNPVLRHRGSFIVIAAVLTLLIVATGVIAATNKTTDTCLSPNDYVALYGEAPFKGHFSPATNFYQKSYTFQPSSAALDVSASDSPTIDAITLAAFYKARPTNPMSFAITTGFLSGDADSKKIAEQRADILSSELISEGIPDSAVTVTVSEYAADDDGVTPDGADTVSLTLTSTGNCTDQ